MKQLGARSKKIYALSTWLVPVMPIFIALITWFNGLKGTETWLLNRPVAFSYIQFVQEISIWIYLTSWSFFFWAVYYKRNGDPWLVEKVQLILDRYQAGAFDLECCPTDIPKDHNRVTLFRHQAGFFVKHWSAEKWYWPWGKHKPTTNFLVPVLRSGHISKNTSIAFAVYDDSDRTEGVAGNAWARGAVALSLNLPQMDTSSSIRAKKSYAKDTFCDETMIQTYIDANRPMPRSIVAIPVERKGKMWGIIVLDSRYPNGLTEKAANDYKLTVALLGHLLERAA